MKTRMAPLQIRIPLEDRAAIQRFCGLNGYQQQQLITSQLRPLIDAIKRGDGQRVARRLARGVGKSPES